MSDYSIVVPVYYNEGSLRYTAERIRSEVFQKAPQWRGEIVFVDDGSQDGSLAELLQVQKDYPAEVRIIKLSRNFGQTNAVWCGMEHTDGPIIMISADGQDPVELMPQMLGLYFNEGIELVIATRQGRDESWFRKITSNMVYSVIRKLGCREMPAGGFDYLLIGAKAKAAYLKIWQPNTFFQIRILDLGFPRRFLPCRREGRKAGVSRWTLAKKVTYMIDGVLGHSYLPIRLMSILGLIFSSVSFLLGLFFFVAYFFNPRVVPGLTPIMLLTLFIGGVQMMMIGVLGEYLWRILAQSRQNPPYIIEKIYDGSLG